MTIKRKISNLMLVLLAMSLIMTSFAGLANAAAPSDVKGSWAEKTLSEWLSKGWLNGYADGSVKPGNAVTRAEFIKLANNALGLTEKTDVSYSDVKSGNWKYDQIAMAVKAGYIHGYENGTMRPENNVSRQEVAVMVAAAFHLDLTQEGESKLTDADKISSWAKMAVGALVAKGIVNGYPDGTFKPKASISRAEAVVILDNAVKANVSVETYSTAGTFGPAAGAETIAGNVTISAGGVTLQNTVITGNLLLAESIGEGDVYLNNVTVKGTTIVRGGGANSVHMIDTVLVTVIVDKETGDIRIVAEGKTTVKQVTLKSGAKLESNTTSGAGFSTVTLSDQLPAGSSITLLGMFHIIEIDAPAVNVELRSGLIDILSVSNHSLESSLIVSEDARIVELVLNAIVKVLGLGTIEKVTLSDNAKGSTFETMPLKTESSNTSTTALTSSNAGVDLSQTAALAIGTTNPTNGQVGVPYSSTFTSTGGTGTKTYTVTAGILPAGLTLATTGALTGTPTAEGVSTFTVMVTDSATPAVTNSHSFTLVIDPPLTGAAAINAATSIATVQALLGLPDNQAELGLSMNNYYLLMAPSRYAVATAVYNGGWDYISAAEIKSAFNHEVAIQTMIMAINNAATKDIMLQLLIARHSELGLNVSSESDFASLTVGDRTAAAAAMMNRRPYGSVAAIRDVFEAQVAMQAARAAINAAPSAAAVRTLLETLSIQSALGLNMDSYMLLSTESRSAVVSTVYNRGWDYAFASEIKLAFDAEVASQPIITLFNELEPLNDSMYNALFATTQTELGWDLKYYWELLDAGKLNVTKAIYYGRPYTTAASLWVVVIKEIQIQTLIKYMNDAEMTTAEVLQLLEDGQHLLGFNPAAVSAFHLLTDVDKTALTTAMISKRPYDTAAAIKAAFEAEFAD